MPEPFFSIIISTFNRSELLIKTVRSVLDSTFDDFEIVVVDDGSTDDTRKQILNLRDKRVSYVFIENSGGPARPRNLGILNSKGKWLCFLDSDDLFSSQKLERLHNQITSNPCVDLFYHKLTYIHSEYTVGNQFDFISKKALYRLLLANPIPLSGTCVSKPFVSESNILFNEDKEFTAVEDWDFWISAYIYGCRFQFIDEVLGLYNDLATDSIARNHHQVFKTRMVSEKHRHRLPTFQSFCVKEYWAAEVMRSSLLARRQWLAITRNSIKRYAELVARAVAFAAHPLGFVSWLDMKMSYARNR
jgi:glycosyltransferase involved in cell wall biosynthesis